MIKLRLFVIFLLPMLVAGCGDAPKPPPTPSYAERATVEMIGMSLREIFTCLGQPAGKSAAGSVETWSYSYGTCTVNMTVVNGIVKDSDFTAPHSDDKTWDEQCETIPEVASCVRWLRH